MIITFSGLFNQNLLTDILTCLYFSVLLFTRAVKSATVTDDTVFKTEDLQRDNKYDVTGGEKKVSID